MYHYFVSWKGTVILTEGDHTCIVGKTLTEVHGPHLYLIHENSDHHVLGIIFL